MQVKTAIVHDYLNQAGGAERVVGVLHDMFPSAPIYTSILDRASLWPSLKDADIRPSWMQHIPNITRDFKLYFPFYGYAIERFDLSAYDLVISSSSAFAKGAKVRAGACHICYCHTPMRFVWDYDRYMEREKVPRILQSLLPPVIRRMKTWDVRTCNRPHVYVANSSAGAERISRYYGRGSQVIFPPVDTSRQHLSDVDEDYYLIVSRLNTYKRVDLAVDAFSKAGRPLVVIGDGPARHDLEGRAARNVRFLGRLPDNEVAEYYSRCRAFVLPGEEDFGITPLEANAAGRPVIAYRAGGALDTVVPQRTGVFFEEQSVESLLRAVEAIESKAWDKRLIRQHAARFSEQEFRRRFTEVVERSLAALSLGL